MRPWRDKAEGEEEAEGRIGIFPSWNALYWTVAAYTVLLVLALQLLSTALDHTTS